MYTAPDKVIYEYSDICICGCKFKDHDNLDGLCWGCYKPPSLVNCYEFKLDNLKYVEDKAKERNLI